MLGKNKEVKVKITAVDRFTKVLRKISGSLKKWGVGALKIAGGVVGGITAVTAALGLMFVKLSDSIDEQAKAASALGVQNEALGVMRDAAGYAGVSVSNLTTALKKMSQGIADATNGTGEAKDAIAELGLSADELQRIGPEKAFAAIIEKLDKIPNGIKKTALAMDLFGRSGAAMANMTSKGLREAQKDADTLKLKLTSAQAANVEAANDAWAKIKNAGSDFLKHITATLAPGIKKGFDSAFEFIKGQDLKAWAAKASLGIARAFQVSVVVLGGVAEAVIAITRGLTGAVAIINGLTEKPLKEMLQNRIKELEDVTARIKKLESGEGWGWSENNEEMASLKAQKVKKTGQISSLERSLDQSQNIAKIVKGVEVALSSAQGFSTSPEVIEAMNRLETMVGDLNKKSVESNSGAKTKETAGRIEIAFSGTEKAISIAKEKTEEFNSILAKTGGIATTSADTAVARLGRISGILDDIANKAGVAGVAIANIPKPPSLPDRVPTPAPEPQVTVEDLARALEGASNR